MIWLLVIAGPFLCAFVLCASLDPAFRRGVRRRSVALTGLAMILVSVVLLSGPVFAYIYHKPLQELWLVGGVVSLGICGLYLMQRSRVLPKRTNRLTLLLLGFFLTLMAYLFLESAYLRFLKLKSEWSATSNE